MQSIGVQAKKKREYLSNMKTSELEVSQVKSKIHI